MAMYNNSQVVIVVVTLFSVFMFEARDWIMPSNTTIRYNVHLQEALEEGRHSASHNE